VYFLVRLMIDSYNNIVYFLVNLMIIFQSSDESDSEGSLFGTSDKKTKKEESSDEESDSESDEEPEKTGVCLFYTGNSTNNKWNNKVLHELSLHIQSDQTSQKIRLS